MCPKADTEAWWRSASRPQYRQSHSLKYCMYYTPYVHNTLSTCNVQVLKAAKEEGVSISKVLTTHKHNDHAGGNSAIAKSIPGLEIVGGEKDRVQGCTSTVKDGDEFSIGSIEVKCLHTPGHTVGHICYYVTEGEQKAVFTGDTLFVGGAGRFFEGTPEEMQHSLAEKLGKLPPETLVYCGHEVRSRRAASHHGV